MSMVFQLRKASKPSCPGCSAGYAVPKDAGDTIECLTCGINFCKIPPRQARTRRALGYRDMTDDSGDQTAVVSFAEYFETMVQDTAEMQTVQRCRFERDDDPTEPTFFRRVRMLEPSEAVQAYTAQITRFQEQANLAQSVIQTMGQLEVGASGRSIM